jgi:hypothetical protein
MLWIFAIVATALLVINLQLLVLYKRRAHELRKRQDVPRRRIREHVEGMRAATAKTRSVVATRLEEMTFMIGHTKARSDALSRAIAGLEEQFQIPDDAANPGERLTRSAGPQDEKTRQKEGVELLRRQQEEIGGHLTSMRREMEIVRRSLERLEGRIQRHAGRQEGAA